MIGYGKYMGYGAFRLGSLGVIQRLVCVFAGESYTPLPTGSSWDMYVVIHRDVFGILHMMDWKQKRRKIRFSDCLFRISWVIRRCLESFFFSHNMCMINLVTYLAEHLLPSQTTLCLFFLGSIVHTT